MFPVLETQRLFLREITMQDAIPIYSYLSLDEVTRYYGRESMESLEQAEEIVALFDTNYRDKRGGGAGESKEKIPDSLLEPLAFIHGSQDIAEQKSDMKFIPITGERATPLKPLEKPSPLVTIP